jgi:uncharacterized membrane protein YkvA (DUF1232 family)
MAGQTKALAVLPPSAESEEQVRSEFWRKLRRFAGRLPFAEDAVAAWFCAFDPRTPLKAKAILIGALAYFLLPADAVPDVLTGLGFTDDAAVLFAAIRSVAPYVRENHRAQAREALETEGLSAHAP